MVHLLRSQAYGLARVAHRVLSAFLVLLVSTATLSAQQPPAAHLLNAGVLPPGAIGREQLKRGGPLPGYFQPVEVVIPTGARIAPAVDGQFEEPQPGVITAGMLIGSVYRFRLTSIPGDEGVELFPTVEVIDRLYPPVGMEARFPITIELAQEDIELAIRGKFVTRVVYLEDPEGALPIAQKPHDQPYFEAGRGQDPLEVADRLGRPVAILRMGGRVPDASGPDQAFLFGSPPLLRFTKPAPAQKPADPANQASSRSTTPTALMANANSAAVATDQSSALPPLPKRRSKLSLQNTFLPRHAER